MPETTEVPLAESKEWKEPEKESPKEPKKAEAPPEPKQRGQAEPRREPESEIAEPKEPKEPRIAVVPKGEGPVLVPMAGVVGPVPVPTPAEPSAGDALPEGAAALDLPESGSKAPVGRRKRHSRIVGTPHYMAPELLNGEPSTRQTDVYAMGALLFESHSLQLSAESPSI